ncbi:MAG: DinB family protein [Pyrinomonadaceae bacterium]
MDNDQALREHLVYLLRGGGAHVDFEGVVADFPVTLINRRVEHIPYTPWQVLEHMRIAQWDILEFSRNAGHVSPPWPKGYWPADEKTGDAGAWNESVAAFRADLKEMESLVADESVDLFAPIAHGEGQTILREALLVADHNAYHLGVLVTLKRILSAS